MADTTATASTISELPPVAPSFLLDSSGREDTASLFQLPNFQLVAAGEVGKAGWKRISTRQWVRDFRDIVAALFAYPYNTFFNSFFLASGYYGDMVSDEMYQRYKSKYPQTTSERRRSSRLSRQSRLSRGEKSRYPLLESSTSGGVSSFGTSRTESNSTFSSKKGLHAMAKTATMLTKLEHAALDTDEDIEVGGAKGKLLAALDRGERRGRKTRRIEPMVDGEDADQDDDRGERKKRSRKTVRVPEEPAPPKTKEVEVEK